MNIILTGSSGYLGSSIETSLIQKGHTVIHPLNENGGKWRLGQSLNDDQIKTCNYFIHSAWEMNPTQDVGESDNLAGSRKILLELSSNNIPVVFISTMSSFDSAESEYGKAKFEIENLVLSKNGIVVRPGLIWSENNNQGILEKLMKIVTLLPIVPYISNIKFPLYLVNREDLASFISNIFDKKFESRIFIAANPKPYFLKDILKSISDRKNLSRIFIPVPVFVVYFSLLLLEKIGVRLFKIDSLIGLVKADPKPFNNGSQTVYSRDFFKN